MPNWWQPSSFFSTESRRIIHRKLQAKKQRSSTAIATAWLEYQKGFNNGEGRAKFMLLPGEKDREKLLSHAKVGNLVSLSFYRKQPFSLCKSNFDFESLFWKKPPLGLPLFDIHFHTIPLIPFIIVSFHFWYILLNGDKRSSKRKSLLIPSFKTITMDGLSKR